MEQIGQFRPVGKLNSDDNDRDIPAEDYRYANFFQIGFSDIGKIGVAHTFTGNELVSPDYQIFGNLKTIGKTEDTENNAIIYFVRQLGTPFSAVVRHYSDNEQGELIVFTSLINLNDNLINTARVIQGELTWTQRGEPPKAFDIEKMRLFYSSAGTDPNGYPSINEGIFLAGNRPPNFRPKARYAQIEGRKTNFVASKVYQFAYFYVYEDFGESQMSPFSTLMAPTYHWGLNGRVYDLDEYRNGIEITYYTGYHTVKEIKFAYRVSNTGAWYVFNTVNKENEGVGDDVFANILFTGLETPIPYQRQQRNYDDLPITADFQEFLITNELAYGNFEKGMDKVDPDVSFTVDRVEVTPEGTDIDKFNIYGHTSLDPEEDVEVGYADYWFEEVPSEGTIISGEIKPVIDLYNAMDTEPGDPFPIESGGTYTFSWTSPVPAFQWEYVIGSDDVNGGLETFMANLLESVTAQYQGYKEEIENAYPGVEDLPDPVLIDEITDLVQSNYTAGVVLTQDLGNKIALSFQNCFITLVGCSLLANTQEEDGVFYLSEGVTGGEIDVVQSFKAGSYAQFVLNYYDDFNRDCQGVTQKEMFRVYIPWHTEFPLAAPFALHRHLVTAEINHLPPSDATHYKWGVHYHADIQSFGVFQLDTTVEDPDEPGQIIGCKVKPYPSDLTPAQEYSDATINHSITKGDVIRFFDGGFNPEGYSEGRIQDVRIDDQTGEITIISNIIEEVEPTQSLLCEIYTPADESEIDEDFYFEFGPEYRIENGFHKGGTQDQTDSQPAISSFSNGGVWVRPRYGSAPDSLSYIEDDRFSDYFQLAHNDRGRVIIYDSEARRRRFETGLIHGGKRFEESNLNDLFTIIGTNQINLSSDNGAISGMKMNGYTLKVIQERSPTSVYIGRTAPVDAGGDASERYELLDRTFGTTRPMSSNVGSQNPESVVKTNNYVYYFDLNNGVWVRNAYNGVIEISREYKYDIFWRNKAAEIRELGREKFNILTGYDQPNDLLYCCIQTDDPNLEYMNECVLFKERENKWVGHLKIKFDMIGSVGDGLYTFRGLDAYRHNRGNFGEFYGVQHSPEIEVVLKSNSFLERVFRSLSMQSNKAMEAESLEVPREYSSTKRDMVSRIKAENFSRQESNYFAAVRRDINTPGFESEVAALNRGDSMRGKALKVKLKGEGYCELYALIVFENKSRRTP